MSRKSKRLTEEQKEQVRLNPPFMLNSFEVAALTNKSVKAVREWMNEPDFPLLRGPAKNSEMHVLRDKLVEWMTHKNKQAEVTA